jgi:GntR family transcriptional repressor for pyruvate dehydrogenase complex
MLNLPEKQTLADRVVEYIHELVRDHNLSPGDSLPTEREIAVALGVSRGPVREGMGRLRAMGFIESRTKAGARLVETSPRQLFKEILPALAQTESQVIDLVEFRAAIEVEAATLAATRRTDENLVAIQEVLEVGRQSIDEGVNTYYEADKQFHIAILCGSHNNLLAASASVIGDFVNRASDFAANATADQLHAAMLEAQTDHEQVFRAIKLRDPAAAGALMRMHLQQILEMAGLARNDTQT